MNTQATGSGYMQSLLKHLSLDDTVRKDSGISIVKAACLLHKGKTPLQKDVSRWDRYAAKWWKLIRYGCCCIAFFLLFPFPFLDENQDILGVGCLDKRDSSVQLDQILHCLYSYSKAGWKHNHCRAQRDNIITVGTMCACSILLFALP